MKKTLLFILPLAAILLVALTSCNKSDKEDGDDFIVDNDSITVDDPFMQVCQHVSNINKEVKKYFKICNDIGELNNYVEDIKRLRYVEDVYSAGTSMYVKIKDFGTISFDYFLDDDAAPSKQNGLLKQVLTRAAEEGSTAGFLGLENAVIINQQYGDERRQWSKDAATIAYTALEKCGIKCTPNDTPSMKFFQNELFEYDIVFFITHGAWDPVNQVHWLYTAETPSAEEKADFDADDLYKLRGEDRDQVTLGTIRETRNGVANTLVSYIKVSEKYIQNANKDFKKKGKAIFFNVGCQTMMGDYPRAIDENKRSDSLARILNERGVGFYLGFDESNKEGQRAGMLFMGKLASGMSLRGAYESLPNACLHDPCSGEVVVYNEQLQRYLAQKSWVADLLPFPTYSDSNLGIADKSIVSSVLGEFNDNSTNSYLRVTLNAKSPLYYDRTYLETFSSNMGTNYINDFSYSLFRYGFEYSTNENFSNAKRTKGMAVNSTGCSFSDNEVSFTQTLTDSELSSNTTYYYRAYFYDGYYYNYSKPDKFKTKNLLSGGGADIPDVPGSDF